MHGRFIENPNTTAVRTAGEPCNLLSGDWLRATRWINLPESLKFGTNGTCKYPVLIVNTFGRDVSRIDNNVEETWEEANII